MKNYNRFFTALENLPPADEPDELRHTLVMQYTNGRTPHLYEMTIEEYSALCTDIENQDPRRVLLRRYRSKCLSLMKRIGIDTTNWKEINKFCLSPRISGHVFASLTIKDLSHLRKQLYAIVEKQNKQS